MAYAERGSAVRCTIGNAIAVHESFSFDWDTNTGVNNVRLLGRKVTWPTHTVVKATTEELKVFELENEHLVCRH